MVSNVHRRSAVLPFLLGYQPPQYAISLHFLSTPSDAHQHAQSQPSVKCETCTMLRFEFIPQTSTDEIRIDTNHARFGERLKHAHSCSLAGPTAELVRRCSFCNTPAQDKLKPNENRKVVFATSDRLPNEVLSNWTQYDSSSRPHKQRDGITFISTYTDSQNNQKHDWESKYSITASDWIVRS